MTQEESLEFLQSQLDANKNMTEEDIQRLQILFDQEAGLIIRCVDYTINSVPKSISMDCPYCKEEIELPFKREYWGNDGEVFVECPECGKEIELGDWIYD